MSGDRWWPSRRRSSTTSGPLPGELPLGVQTPPPEQGKPAFVDGELGLGARRGVFRPDASRDGLPRGRALLRR
eukprot:8760329-Lingulodinium_polyedra.AAC.1